MSSKSDNIKNYYIQKRIKENTLKAKLNTKQIRLNKEYTLENILWENLINRMCIAYDSKNIKRIIPYKILIGCNEINLYKHLKSLLTKDLKMEDYPKWEIDHIKPINCYNLNDEKEQLECFNYKNLQPLLKELNQKKPKK